MAAPADAGRGASKGGADSRMYALVVAAVAALLTLLLRRDLRGTPGLGAQVFGRRRVVVFECPGGTDKGPDGHRADTAPLLSALSEAGFHADAVFYSDARSQDLIEELVGPLAANRPAAFISRVDPGEYKQCTMGRFYEFLRAVADAGVVAFNHPDDMEALGQKQSLMRLRGMPIFVNDTALYVASDPQESDTAGALGFVEFFPGSLRRSGQRVLKQNRGSKGEGVWWVSVQQEQPKGQEGFGNASFVRVVEASDNHQEVMTVADLLDRMTNKYLRSRGGSLIDMPFLPRIAEGEVRLIISGRRVTHVVEKTPAAVKQHPKAVSSEVFSANLDAGARHVWHLPEHFPSVVEPFNAQLEEILARVGVRLPPPLWTADFIRTGPVNQTRFVLSEINANCVGFKAFPGLARELASSVAEVLGVTSTAF